MVGQFGGMGIDVVRIQLFQGLADPCMQPGPPGGGQLLGQGFLNQSIGELLAGSRPRWLFDDSGGNGLFKGLQHTVFSFFYAQGM